MTEEFEGEFECLEKKNITFSVPLKKENDNDKIITYRLKFIDSYRFMPNFYYPILLITYPEFIIKNVRNTWKEKKVDWIVNLSDLKIADCIINANNANNKLTNESIKNCPTLYKFCHGDLNKYFLLLRKGIYPYEYIDSQKRCHLKKHFNAN